MPVYIHNTADVQSSSIGDNTNIWQNVTVLPKAVIGRDVNICAQCFIENDVVVGDRSTLKCGVYVWDGVRIGNDVYIGSNVTFSNDAFPRSKKYPLCFAETVVQDRASVGDGAILAPGITIGRNAMVELGAVVMQSVPPHAIVSGNPAQIIGYDENVPALPDVERPFPVAHGEALRVGVGDVTLHSMKIVTDLRGNLSAGEFPTDIPFEPKRYFLVFDVPNEKTRGAHAHYKCKQFLICVKGSCAVVVDDGTSRCEITLDSPGKGIYLPPMVWGIQYKYSPDAVLLVLTSHMYDSTDYIRDYDTFLASVR